MKSQEKENKQLGEEKRVQDVTDQDLENVQGGGESVGKAAAELKNIFKKRSGNVSDPHGPRPSAPFQNQSTNPANPSPSQPNPSPSQPFSNT